MSHYKTHGKPTLHTLEIISRDESRQVFLSCESFWISKLMPCFNMRLGGVYYPTIDIYHTLKDGVEPFTIKSKRGKNEAPSGIIRES